MELLLKDAPIRRDSLEVDIADKDMNALMTKIQKMKRMTPQELENQRKKLRDNRQNPFALNNHQAAMVDRLYKATTATTRLNMKLNESRTKTRLASSQDRIITRPALKP